MKKLSILLFLFIGLSTTTFAQRSESHNSAISRNLEIFNEIYKMLDIYYVDSLSADTVMEWAVDGMLERVDPFTSYYKEDDEELREMATGKYAGIGSVVRYHKKKGRVCISDPHPGTPSYKAGLKPGDEIISIDGKDIKGIAISKVTSMLRGEAGTTFELVFQRPGEKKPRAVNITRATISTPNVPYYGMINGNIGYILLNEFTEGAAKNVREAFLELRSKGAEGLVFDLRDNPGGALSEAVDIVNLFVGKGVKVVYTKGKLAPTNRDFFTTTEPIDTIMPMVVLVNGGTASSAEIVSGTLQDLDRAVIMGTRTYGKGLVQTVRDVPFRGQFKVTTSRYYIPSGRCIQAYAYNHDGTTKVVADSLQKVFHTRGGREVRDGGGIKPDTISQPDSLSTLVYDLVQSDAFFDYGTDYMQKHPTIASPSEFRLSDQEYDEFVNFIVSQDFTYNQRSTEILKLLRDWAKREGYLETAEAEMKALEAKFHGNLHDDLYRLKSSIKGYIEGDLVSRYYSVPGYIEYVANTNKTVKVACDLLQDKSAYNKILK